MARMRLTDQADLGVIYDADAPRWDPELLKRYGVTRERVVQFYAGCPSVGFEIDGKPVGGLLFDGKQAHIGVLPEYYGRWAVLFKPALKWLFSIQDPILIEIEADNERCLRFMDRNQWRRVKETDKAVTYEVTSKTPVLTRSWKSRTPQEDAEATAASS